MYNFQDCGETSKEMLSDDDIQSMCVLYPATAPLPCAAPDSGSGGGCCSASGDSDPEGALLISAAVALVMGRRRHGRG